MQADIESVTIFFISDLSVFVADLMNISLPGRILVLGASHVSCLLPGKFQLGLLSDI